mmetsp:Transcript_902/g.1444  ORF Transcript_902/g.1444 Transcript_902/m.1444 type:complete len:121 (-) Transcript_902:845-1207(-)
MPAIGDRRQRLQSHEGRGSRASGLVPINACPPPRREAAGAFLGLRRSAHMELEKRADPPVAAAESRALAADFGAACGRERAESSASSHRSTARSCCRRIRSSLAPEDVEQPLPRKETARS